MRFGAASLRARGEGAARGRRGWGQHPRQSPPAPRDGRGGGSSVPKQGPPFPLLETPAAARERRAGKPRRSSEQGIGKERERDLSELAGLREARSDKGKFT